MNEKCSNYDYCKSHLGETSTNTHVECPYKFCPHFDEFKDILKNKGFPTLLDSLIYEFNIPTPKYNFTEEGYEIELPIEWFEGCQVIDKETGEFLGWVDAKKHRIIKYEVKEVIKE